MVPPLRNPVLSGGSTWELVRNERSWAPPRPTDAEALGWGPEACAVDITSQPGLRAPSQAPQPLQAERTHRRPRTGQAPAHASRGLYGPPSACRLQCLPAGGVSSRDASRRKSFMGRLAVPRSSSQ